MALHWRMVWKNTIDQIFIEICALAVLFTMVITILHIIETLVCYNITSYNPRIICCKVTISLLRYRAALKAYLTD
jgi:hypothetical protein